jgi:hypothetical protein
LSSFVYGDIGSLIKVVITDLGIDNYYYINGVKAKIKQGGIIYYSWLLSESLNLGETYWILDTSVLDANTALGY